MPAEPLLFAALVTSRHENSPALPPLPDELSYWDDYEETERVIHLATTQRLAVWDDGELISFNFEDCDDFEWSVVVLIVQHMLGRLKVASAVEWLSTFRTLTRRAGGRFLSKFAAIKPTEIRREWVAALLPDLKNPNEGRCLRKILKVFCDHRIGAWSPAYRDMVSSLPSPRRDPFAVVKAGECFMPAAHQQLVYGYLDEIAEASSRDEVDPDDLRSAIAIILADQHALRPGIISRIKRRNVRAHESGAVHVTFTRNKKRRGGRRKEVTRRIKRSWCPIFRSYLRLTNAPEKLGSKIKLLGQLPSGVGKAISDKLEAITGERWTPTDVRHTAAQRLVDSGATALQLAEFMGHEGTFVGNVYFDRSPTQAALINDALALSPIYSALPEIFGGRIIDKEALLRLGEDHQIGAVPHGIPIAGIGGCGLGQSLCTKNPVLSCYTCRRFMALSDPSVHEEVVDSLRPVVKAFHKAGRETNRNPTYAQLRSVMHAAAGLSQQLRSGDGA